MIKRDTLLKSLDTLLEPARFKDYCPNGLQVEGRDEILKIVSGVTASLAFLQAAVDANADAVLVHHGLFWRGQDGCVTGWMRQRLALALAHNINVIAYHLPMDAHPALGNNAQLAEQLDWFVTGRFGDQQLGFLGTPKHGSLPDVGALAQQIENKLGRGVTLVRGHDGPLERIAWCTGGAQSYFEEAIAQGAQVFVTGEISEPQAHYARECGVSYIACGHHASERFGAPAVAAHMANELGLVHAFIDIDNPA
jgi:dinuclear metal center YbgI/SA1388 family protein